MIGSILLFLFCRSSAHGAPACSAIRKSGGARAPPPVPHGAGAYGDQHVYQHPQAGALLIIASKLHSPHQKSY